MSQLAKKVAWIAAIVLGLQFLGALAIQIMMSNTVRKEFASQLSRGLEDSGALHDCTARPGPWVHADGWWSAWPLRLDGVLVGDDVPVERVELPEAGQPYSWSTDEQRGFIFRSNSNDCGGFLLVQDDLYPLMEAESSRVTVLVILRIVSVLLAAVALVWLTAVPLVRRIHALSEDMGSIVADNFEGTVSDDAKDELGEVARAFDAATSTARERLERLEHRDKVMRRALADLAHDLRTPLATLKLSASSLPPSTSATTIRTELDFIEGMAQNFEALMDDEEGEVEQVALDRLVERIKHRFTPVARDRNISFNVGLPDETVVVEAESVALERAVSNLVHNGMRFAMGHVVLLLYRDHAEVRLEVRDDGPGFGGLGKRAAERGVRGDQARGEGFGLGLAIAEASARRFGGRLDLGEGDEGETVVAIVLPASPKDPDHN